MPTGPNLPLADRVRRYQENLHERGGFGGDPSVYAYRYPLVAAALGPGSVVDFGCGLGHLYAYLKDRPYTGLDAVPEFIAAARDKHPEATWVLGDVMRPPFEPRSFDWGVALTLFSYTSLVDAIRTIDRIVSLVREGLVILDNNYLTHGEPLMLCEALATHGTVSARYQDDAQANLYVLRCHR